MSTRHILDLFIPTYLHSWCLMTYKNLYPAPPHEGYWLITDRPSSANDTKYTAYTPHLLSGALEESGSDDDGELIVHIQSPIYPFIFSFFLRRRRGRTLRGRTRQRRPEGCWRFPARLCCKGPKGGQRRS